MTKTLKEIEKYVYMAFVSRLFLAGFEIKEKVCGATTLFNGREIDLTDWFSGFWAKNQQEYELYNDFGYCANRLFEKAKELCPQKVIAVGQCQIDKTSHADYGDNYYNVMISFGGY